MDIKDGYLKNKGDLQSSVATNGHRNEFRIIYIENKVLPRREDNLT